MDFLGKDGRYRASIALAIALFAPIAAVVSPARAQGQCQQETGYTLCFDRDWLRYYNQPYAEFDWQNYIQSQTPPQASDYYDSIDRIYRELLERAADEEALTRWSNALLTGMSLPEVRRAIAESEAVQTRIHAIYRAELGRRADESGLETWTRKLGEGATLAEVREEIATSEEALRLRQENAL
jgi:hypothetical protein